jgi:hypothetical protein
MRLPDSDAELVTSGYTSKLPTLPGGCDTSPATEFVKNSFKERLAFVLMSAGTDVHRLDANSKVTLRPAKCMILPTDRLLLHVEET